MQLKEILTIEQNRNEDTKCVIHLFQEGSFYRAYEWSAWLCVNYIKSDMKVTHRKTKTEDIGHRFLSWSRDLSFVPTDHREVI